MIQVVDCMITMILLLVPAGASSEYNDLLSYGSCFYRSMSPYIVNDKKSQFYLILEDKKMKYAIPLPQRKDRVRISYIIGEEYAYIGDCRYGLKPYVYMDGDKRRDSICQKVMTLQISKEGT